MNEHLTTPTLPSNLEKATASTSTNAFSIFRRLIHDSRLSHGAFRFWHYLRDRKDKNGQTWPKQSTIATDLHCKESSLTRWTKELKGAGYISVERMGQNHHYRYTILPGDDRQFVPPQWASRKESRTPQMGDAKQIASPPNGNVALPKEASPRAAHLGGLSNTHQVNSTSKLSDTEIILRSDELKEVKAAMKSISGSYDSHQSWSAVDKTEFCRLKSRREELKQLLDLTV